MSASLLDLPDEILVLIFSNLHTSNVSPDDDDGDLQKIARLHRLTLCSLAQTNRRLHNVVYPIQIEDISLSITGNSEDWRETAGAKLAYLCAETPAIFDRMRKFRIRWNSRTPNNWTRGLSRTIGNAKDLTRLKLEGFDDRSVSKSHCKSIENLVSGLQRLETVVLDMDGFDMTASLFLQICGLPHLRSFETRSRVYGLAPLRDVVASSEYCLGTSRNHSMSETVLTSLRCSGEYVDLETLRLVLSKAPGLKKLRTTLPGPGVIPDFGMKPVGGRSFLNLGATYRPDLVTKALLPSSSTIEELVCMNHEVGMPNNNGGVVDLSSFHALRKVCISIRLLCRTDFRNEPHPRVPSPLPRSDWYQKLPKRLQTLEVHFDYSRGLLWNKSDLDALKGNIDLNHNHTSRPAKSDVDAEQCQRLNFEFSRRIFTPRVAEEIAAGSRLSWATEMIRSRFEHLSSLTSFKVIESAKTGRRQRRAWDGLDLAAAYPETFGCPEVDFQLLVRTPPGYIAPSITSLRIRDE